MSGASPSALLGQTVLIIGSCTGIGLATARRAKGEGAQLILTDRHAGPLEDVADEIGVEATVAFDESDAGRLETFLAGLPGNVDHVMLSGGEPYAARLGEIDLARARDALEQLLMPICIARYARQEMRDGGSLVFVAGAGRPGDGRTLAAITAAALPALVANLAVEAVPVRVNLIIWRPGSLGGVAERAVQLMTDPVVTGATLGLDDGG
ncbi:SDR family oxidoreductase [Actinoplanes sp. NPDC051513]|uniref:SDR family oxidoreductase n=1 Tax=Actinoplanes sp. NPDC051513 TaxID=3363908 RepID=UPI0037BAA33D